jgi:Nuclease-related domain/Uncharacterized conserved protein (DUF2075)
MANQYTKLPSKQGEKNLAIQLTNFSDDKLHLWFSIDFVPGVRDNDVLLCHEEAGFFVIEVKAVPITAIEKFGWESYKITGRHEDRPPHRQADEAMHSLRNFLSPQMPKRKPPFMIGTACFPLISRAEWNGWWDDNRVVGDYAERLIFREDFESGAEALINRLKFIYKNPPLKEGSRYDYSHRMEQLDAVKKSLDVSAKRKPTPSDLERLKAIEDRVARETLNEARPGEGRRILYYGYPGTGKTFRLLQLGVAHALAGYKTLYVCFNHVLAADIQRLFSYSEKLRINPELFKPQDVFAVASSYSNIKAFDMSHDEWGEKVLQDLRARARDLPKYDAILIDEAQDIKDWALQMLELFAAPDATICVASGRGQEFYGQASEWLKRFAESAQKRELRRNFRNSAPVGYLAHIFFEAFPKSQKIEGIVHKLIGTTDKDNQGLFFERTGGKIPSLLNINEQVDEGENDDFSISTSYFERLIDEYSRIIKFNLEQLKQDERPLDLLILVPTHKGLEARVARRALDKLGAIYIDYINEEFRRHIAQPDMIRLCTFHSSRGIEGRRVLIFGIEQLESLSQRVDVEPQNLGYVVLSRSVFECVICVRPSTFTKEVEFIQESLKHLQPQFTSVSEISSTATKLILKKQKISEIKQKPTNFPVDLPSKAKPILKKKK